MQSPRDHEMKDEEQVVVQLEDDSLAEPTETADGPACGPRQRRVNAAQEKWIGQPDLVQRPAHDAEMQTFEIDDDVLEFGHGTSSGIGRARDSVSFRPAG